MPLNSIKRYIQNILMSCYRWELTRSFFASSLGQGVYAYVYFIYKRYIEAGAIKNLQPLVKPGTWVIDVGANIGFFTVHFCSWTSHGGKVIALEPEARNYSLLARTTHKNQQHGLLEILQVAADCRDGSALLTINPFHPGDHKLGADGIEITTITLDTLLSDRGNPTVSLIKIDVQGAEMRVLEGVQKTIEQSRPAFWIEIDQSALQGFGATIQDIFTFFTQRKYMSHTLVKARPPEPITMETVEKIVRERRYTDILFLPIEPEAGRDHRPTAC